MIRTIFGIGTIRKSVVLEVEVEVKLNLLKGAVSRYFYPKLSYIFKV